MTQDHEHEACMHSLLSQYKEAKTDQERDIVWGMMHQEVAMFDESLVGMSDKDYMEQDGDSKARLVVDQWLKVHGLKKDGS